MEALEKVEFGEGANKDKQGYVLDSQHILQGIRQIIIYPDEKRTKFRESTKSALREMEKDFEEFINNGCKDGYVGLENLLNKFIVSYTDEIKEQESISVSSELKFKLRGDSGEFFVTAELCRRNVLVALPPQSAPLFDLIASNVEGEKTAYIQVKTTMAENKWGSHWQLNSSFLEEKNHYNLRSTG